MPRLDEEPLRGVGQRQRIVSILADRLVDGGDVALGMGPRPGSTASATSRTISAVSRRARR